MAGRQVRVDEDLCEELLRVENTDPTDPDVPLARIVNKACREYLSNRRKDRQ